jgi:manganese/zinc/iron transport system substrate-binding protein
MRCWVVVWLLVMGLGCRPDPARETAESGGAGISVLVTTGMIADIAQAVVGDAGRVTVLMGPGVDPHLYQPTTRDQRRLRQADVVLYNGLHLEGKMVEVFEALAREKTVVAVTAGIPADRLLGGAESGGQPDPHVWFDVGLWKLATQVVIDTLTAAAPHEAEGFRSRGERYLEELEILDQYCRQRFAELPPERRILVTSHDAFQYLGRAYGLEVFGIQGMSTESEAGLRRLAECVDLIRSRKVAAIFPESSVSPAAVQRVAQDSGVRLGPELYSDALGAADGPAGTYRGMIRQNVDLIVEALREQPL